MIPQLGNPQPSRYTAYSHKNISNKRIEFAINEAELRVFLFDTSL
jgi:hypothetical protein